VNRGQAAPDDRTASRASSSSVDGAGSTGAAHCRGPCGAHPANSASGARNNARSAATAGEPAETAFAATDARLCEQVAFTDQATREQQAGGFGGDWHF